MQSDDTWTAYSSARLLSDSATSGCPLGSAARRMPRASSYIFCATLNSPLLACTLARPLREMAMSAGKRRKHGT
eukprot:20042-Eustigmatos_ZCMA.PRE.1